MSANKINIIKKFLLVFCALFFATYVNSVDAVEVARKKINDDIRDWAGSARVVRKVIGDNYAYCTQLSYDAPTHCSSSETYNTINSAALSYIMNSGLKYICKEWAISQYLHGTTYNPGLAFTNQLTKANCGGDKSIDEVLTSAKSHDDKFDDDISFSTSSLSFSKNSSGKYVATANYTVADTSKDSVTCSVTSGTATATVDTANKKVTVTSSAVNSSITVSCSFSHQYNKAIKYKTCEARYDGWTQKTNIQELVVKGSSETYTKSDSISGTITSPKHKYTILHWKYVGSQRGEVGYPNREFIQVETQAFEADVGSSVTISRENAKNYSGYTLRDTVNSNWGKSESSNKNFGDTFTQPDKDFVIVYFYYPQLTIRYHTNGGTGTYKYSESRTEVVDEDDDIPLQVINYNVNSDSGLSDVQNPDGLYLSRKGYRATGNWLLGSATSNVKLSDQSARIWDGIKVKIGETEVADLSDGPVTIDVYAEWIPDGKIKIKKVNSRGDAVISKNLTLDIYSDSSCTTWESTVTADTGGSGIFEIPNLVVGRRYYAKETVAPTGYYAYPKDEDRECVPIGKAYVGFATGGKELSPVEIVNKTKCEVDFEKGNGTILTRLAMFPDYPTFNNLLDFSITSASDACSNHIPEYNKEDGCLVNRQNHSTDFSTTNLSNANEIITIDSVSNTRAFCLTEFNLESNVSMPDNKIKAGMFVISQQNNIPAVTAVLTKTCYVYGDENAPASISSVKNKYSNYINSISMNGQKLLYDENVAEEQFDIVYYSNSGNGFKMYKAEQRVAYYFNPVYVYKISGKPCESNTNECRLIGNGIISEFQDGKTTNNSFSFEIDFRENLQTRQPFGSYMFIDASNNCNYKVDDEIIKYPNSTIYPSGRLELEFRAIDTNNPFGRQTNTNWCDGNKCDKNNSIVSKYITGSEVNNSYNKTGTGSLYTNQITGTKKIILTPSLIQDIRTYNSTHSYDDYEFSCDELTGVCENSFLKQFGIVK